MPFVATASRTVRNKNIILILMCAGFAFFFAKDGFYSWERVNDASVATAADNARKVFTDAEVAKLKSWPEHKSDAGFRDEIHELLKRRMNEDLPFHSDTDLMLQKALAVFLIGTVVASIWYTVRCQRRRAVLDETAKTLSPAPGLTFPIDAITKVDNTRWKKTGIVDITSTTPAGTPAETELDDYKLDGLPPLLNELSLLADKAEFINPEAPPAPDEAKPPEPDANATP